MQHTAVNGLHQQSPVGGSAATMPAMSFEHGEKPPDRPAEGAERWMTTIVLALFLGMMGAEIIRDFQPAKLSAIFIPLFWIPLLVLHEFGHAIAARLCGWKVDRVVIGFGKLIRHSTIAGMPVQWRQVPISGYVLPYPTNLKSPRLKNTIIYAGGPGIEVLAIVAVYLVFGSSLFTSSESIPLIAAQSFCVSAAMGLVFTLVPHITTTGGGKSWSDGMGILLSWRLPDSYFRRIMGETP